MMMFLIAVSLGVSALVVLKVLLSWVFSVVLYKVAQIRNFCCRRSDQYQRMAQRNKLSLKQEYSL